MNLLGLSPGDVVATILGLVAIWRWWTDRGDRWRIEEHQRDESSDSKIKRLEDLEITSRKDLDVHIAEDRKDMQYIKEYLAGLEFRLGARLDSVENQLRHVVLGTGSKVIELRRDKRDDDQ